MGILSRNFCIAPSIQHIGCKVRTCTREKCDLRAVIFSLLWVTRGFLFFQFFISYNSYHKGWALSTRCIYRLNPTCERWYFRFFEFLVAFFLRVNPLGGAGGIPNPRVIYVRVNRGGGGVTRWEGGVCASLTRGWFMFGLTGGVNP